MGIARVLTLMDTVVVALDAPGSLSIILERKHLVNESLHRG